jgi:SAM-dependent methyltransferase
VSHPEQQAFIEAVAARNAALVAGGRVLEVGSYDVNGTVRAAFSAAREYVGVDLTPGPGVDHVGYGHEYQEPDGAFDLTISGSCFEHDPHWRMTLENMVRLTKPGGIVAATFASRGFPEHGTRRTLMTDSPGTQAVGLDYYRNLTDDDFSDLPTGEWFSTWRVWHMPTTFEMYVAGIRAGADCGASVDLDADVAEIRSLMPLSHRLARMPLRVVGGIVGHGERYQRLIRPYWSAMFRLSQAASAR